MLEFVASGNENDITLLDLLCGDERMIAGLLAKIVLWKKCIVLI